MPSQQPSLGQRRCRVNSPDVLPSPQLSLLFSLVDVPSPGIVSLFILPRIYFSDGTSDDNLHMVSLQVSLNIFDSSNFRDVWFFELQKKLKTNLLTFPLTISTKLVQTISQKVEVACGVIKYLHLG